MSDPRYSRSRVRGYHRADGTYVRGHYRTKPSSPAANTTDLTDLLPFGAAAFIAFLIVAGLIGSHLPTA